MDKTDIPQNMVDNSGPDKLTLLAFVLIVIFAGANAVAVRFTVAELPPFGEQSSVLRPPH